MILSVGNTVDPDTGEQRPIPDDFLDYWLATKIFGGHVKPSELGSEDHDILMQWLHFWNLEQEVSEWKRQ